MKKCQAAMEFLMIYGWAIMVLLVAIGALTYFGVLSPDQFRPSRCECSYVGYDYKSASLTQDNILFIECSNTSSFINYDKKRIDLNFDTVLYKCVNKTMVKI